MKTIAFIVGRLFTCTRSDLGYLYKRVDLIQEMSFPLLAFHPPDTVKKIYVQIKGSAKFRIVKDAVLLNTVLTLFK